MFFFNENIDSIFLNRSTFSLENLYYYRCSMCNNPFISPHGFKYNCVAPSWEPQLDKTTGFEHIKFD